MRGASTISSADRELIAAYVSHLNDCNFCHSSHASAAACHYGNDYAPIDWVLQDPQAAPFTPKLKAFLALAARVQQGGKKVTESDIAEARLQGATDDEIHQVVLIAAAFCMFNRYVDGLATQAPREREAYRESGRIMAEVGYIRER